MFRKAEAILLDVALTYGVDTFMIKSRSRQRSVVRARKEVVARLRKDTDLSWSEIALVVGFRGGFRGYRRPASPRP